MTLYELSKEHYMTQTEYYNLFKDHFRCGYLQMHTYCQAIKQAMKDMASFIALKKKYQKNSDRNQNPGFPRFKHEHNKLLPTFLKTAVRMKNGNLLLSIGKKMKSERQIKAISIELPEKVYGLLSEKNIKMVTLKRLKEDKYQIKLVYEFEEQHLVAAGDTMALDLGVNNLAGVTFMNRCAQFLIDGKVLKSKIASYNNLIKDAYSSEMSVVGSSSFKLTKKMKRIMKKRNGFIDYYMHKASRMVIELAVKKDVKTIVIGDFKGIKSSNRQKYFVQIPHARFIRQIKYKAKEVGIAVVMQNESYTSTVSAVDLEPVNSEYSDKSKRIYRGLFQSGYGMINADINGSLNILRKYMKDKNNPKLVDQVRDKGFRENPVRLRIV